MSHCAVRPPQPPVVAPSAPPPSPVSTSPTQSGSSTRSLVVPSHAALVVHL
eukprot:CAMPEP_0113257140 /NCGR_PEP_ID=MMETSP0008_2-20120614/15146_1 /TAXON_ID=97485 /ORGANISM="Prymnesium parvum" /LENGTH=50 /DNA_ID=CAMNT_0000105545 /DNA_START=102 /DNA_END=251 /DNA_ORIENTATION=- /assembly_acc=CAM_ASM_000153